MGTFDPVLLEQEYRQLESGEPRMRGIRNAITAAEQAHDHEAVIYFHHALIKESVFSGDRYQALIDFPQYFAAVKKNPETETRHQHNLLWTFKWIVEAATEFYQIDRKQILNWYSEYRRELIRAGYSLKSFYDKRAVFYSYCDRAKFRLDYADYRAAPRDSMSDGKPDELDMIVRWELLLGNRATARKTAQQIFDGGFRSEELPASTYSYLLDDAMQCGDREYAKMCVDALRPLCEGERFKLQRMSYIFCYDAMTDPQTGLAFYRRNASLRAGSRNPFLCYWFDRGACRILRAAAEAGLTLTEYNGKVYPPEQLLAYAEEIHTSAADLASKFDARNRSDYFTQNLDEVYAL